MPIVICVAIATYIAPIASAEAASLKYESSVTVQKTNYFDKFVTLPKFNPELGDLTSVKLTLNGEVQGSIRLESTDASAANVTADLAAEVKLLKPDKSLLLATLPTASVSKQFTTFDDNVDFDGTSGATLNNLSSTKTDSTELTSGFDLFKGLGELLLPVTAEAKSRGTGAGNLSQEFNTFAGAKVEIVYDYVVRIPKEVPKRRVPESQIPLGALAAVGVCSLLKTKYSRLV
ncbi:MAG: choice-of-anchor E domain-containing protein [Methylacidiphilales bacterium]|nr:choice-of-anchor E domain-containing protein [Candidatus Methylacidiphilales bacterium]NJR14380.1 choice-of-anchor E domain-containing protein [Calothrix sp. CSU_2_0]